MKGHILIACIGNIFFGDDGFGVEMARALSTTCLPEEVRVVDYSIRGLDLTYALLQPWDAVIFVDSIRRGGPPGTLYRLRPAGADDSSQTVLHAHALDPAQVLRCARGLGQVTAKIYLIACEPEDLGDQFEGRMGLSPAVTAAIPQAVQMVRSLAATLVEAVEHANENS
jgi:hydrogenase maturation protease